MPRVKRPSLRGSVTQSSARLRARETSRFGFVVRLTAMVGSLVLVTCVCLWLWHIGWPQREAGRMADAGLHMTQQAQFAVKDIVVEGRQQTSRDAITNALNTSQGAPILGFDAAAAQARIAKLPWVDSATVERRLPDTILVRLNERTPMARWQYETRTTVIDGKGKDLPDAKPEQFTNLPLVVGSDAPDETANLLALYRKYPDVAAHTTAAVRVSERRWDLHLEPKVTARMPETDLEGAFKRLSLLITDGKILERNIVAIDLRIPDRLVVEPANTPADATPHATGDVHL